MIYCEKGTSVLFPPIDKIIQVYSVRVVEFFACPGKNKRIQNDIECNDECVGPVYNNLETVCIDTDSLETFSTPSSENNSTETSTEQTKEEKMAATDDTITSREPPLLKGAKLNKRGKHEDDYEFMKQDSKKLHRRRKRGQVSRAAQSSKSPINQKSKKEGYPSKMISKLVNTRQSAFDKKSLISLYRKRRRSKLNKECPCPGVNSEALKESRRDKTKKRQKSVKTNIKLELKPKPQKGSQKQQESTDARLGTSVPSDKIDTEKTCYKGICTKALKKKDKDFVCTCEYKKEPSVLCSDNTCGKGIANNSSFVRLKNRVSHLYRKSMQKLKISRKHDFNKICKEGVCKEASSRKNPDITCTCKEKIKKCSDDTCTSTKNKPASNNNIRRISKLSQRLQNIKTRRVSQRNKIQEKVVVQNEIEQTGDPYFEIKVDAIDMCVLNPSEIKTKVLALGEKRKRHRCNCPSHEVRKKYIIEREACSGGACQKALKNKKTDFTCKCLKNKLWTCTDATCNKSVSFGKNENCVCAGEISSNSQPKSDKPLFEVCVDNDNMCIINTEDMRYKLDHINRHRNQLCRSGICREKVNDRNTRIMCKCHKEMAEDECTEQTCGDTACCKCGRNNNKMVRSPFNTVSLKNMKSKFSLFCSRICSNSDNWMSRKKVRKTRTCKKRNIMSTTQSENVHKRDGLKLMIKKHKENENCDNDDCCLCSPNDTVTSKNDSEESNKKEIYTRDNKALKSPSEKNKAKIIYKTKNDVPKNHTATSQRKAEKITAAINEKTESKRKPNKSPIVENEKVESKRKSNRTPEVENDKTKVKQKYNKKHVLENDKDMKVHKRNGLVIPISSSKVVNKPKKVPKKKPNATCLCQNECECDLEMQKRHMKEIAQKRQQRRKGKKTRRKHKKVKKKKRDDTNDKLWAQETLEKRRQFEKEKDEMAKADKVRQKKHRKEEMEVLKLLESEGGARRSNCIVEIIVAVLSAVANVAMGLMVAIFKLITRPKKSYWYIRERMNDTAGTMAMIRKVIRNAWRIRKMKVCKCFKNSETASILSDAFKEGALYQIFADKGKTKKEQFIFEAESRARKKRVSKRREAALYGCRHVLLTTLRKTPCLWVYHVCPEFYPQCLSFLNLLRQFGHMILFLAALACWTPCIVLCELTRGLCCCLLCTG